MQKQYSKPKNIHQKNISAQTWTTSNNNNQTKLNKLSKPLRQTNQQFMTTQYQQNQSYSQPQQQIRQLNKFCISKQKNKGHRRHASQQYNCKFSNQKQEQSQALLQNHMIRYNNSTQNLKLLKKSQSCAYMPIQQSNHIQQKFKQIQSIMGLQNQNLRKQKDYLLRTIHKMQIKQKQMKNQIAQYRQRIIQLQQQNQIIRDTYEKAYNFMANGIGKIQQVVTKQQVQTHISTLIFPPNINQNSLNIQQKIQELNDKFDALMYEYQKTRQPQIRKKCMELAKQLRKLRKILKQEKDKNKQIMKI